MAKTPVSVGFKELHRSYLRKRGNQKIDSTLHRQILEMAGKITRETLLEDGEFKLGNRKGKLVIRMTNGKTNLIDFGHYNKTGEKRYHLNDHSDGLFGKTMWIQEDGILYDKNMWEFHACKALKKSINTRLKAGQQYPRYTYNQR